MTPGGQFYEAILQRKMSSYFVNSISACYGPGSGLSDHCLDPNYDRGAGAAGLVGYGGHGGAVSYTHLTLPTIVGV